ncbi:M48 family metalloprotease, partial [Campylobacter jejuni]|nr:M48 family metalloprotease [Campylobacter jejuni]
LNALSRKNEFAADQHGAKVTSKEDMKNALIALARENKAFIKTSKIYTFYLSHPSISDRIKALS